MPANAMSEIIRQLRSTVLPERADLTDAQLLDCFVTCGEPAAAAALVQRHGAMVWGVCHRILHNYHDTADAFQATFLVLVRKAASIRSRERVANWLYGVAHQTALKARARIARRKQREMQMADMPEPVVTEPENWSELQPVLDKELSRLPEKYRLVIVLCDLEGQSGKEAARQLSLPPGTVSSRLTRGRALLAKRLARHGFAVSGSALAAVLSQNSAAAAVPTAVMSSTIKAVTLAGAGQVTAALASVEVAALVQGVLRDMFLSKFRTMAGLLVSVVLIAGGGLWGQHLVGGNDSTEAAPLAGAPEEGLVPQFNQVAAPPLVVNNDDFIQLFNGKDLTGWKKDPAWSVKGGILTGLDPGFLATSTGPYHDFHLRARVRISDGGKGTILFRGPRDKGPHHGYEMIINANNKDLDKTGSLNAQTALGWIGIYSFQASLVKPGEWFDLELVADRNRFLIHVNGQKTVQDTDVFDRGFTGGPIVLRSTAQSTVEFQKIEIKELKGARR
jgi:RNA polymerase sigma factor (sigma-70 family)